MHKLVAILRELVQREASIESVGKTRISQTPGEVTQIKHN